MAKKISKQELRRAMSEAKKKHSAIKRIESPLARYHLDQLTCVLCKTVVRNEALWPMHLNSKAHKDNVASLASAKASAAPVKTVETTKRPAHTFQVPAPPKKFKGILKNTGQPSSNVQAGLPSDFFENSSTTASNVVLPKADLTNDSNGNSMEVASIEEKATEEKDNKNINQSTLPEGFFDDPIKDAKARNVEYKDPIEEEWERFQKEIKSETAQSAQIIGEEQEEAATERQLDVVEEQLRNWSRVLDLVKKKELIQTVEKKKNNNESSSDEEDFDEFLDWRAKKSYRD